jgi:hypothetical protein
MNRKYIVAAVVGVVGLLAVLLAFAVAPEAAPPVMGAGETPDVKPILSWQTISSVLTLLGGGSIASAVALVLSKAHDVTAIINQLNPAVPVIPNVGNMQHDVADTIELVQASINFSQHKTDKAAISRLFSAVMTEFSDVAAFQSPGVAAEMNALSHAVVDVVSPVAGAK